MLTDEILNFAAQLGFDLAGIIPVGPPQRAAEFTGWLAAGYHGDMAYLAARAAERLDPVRWAPDARSMILLGVNYGAGRPEGAAPRTLRLPKEAEHPERANGSTFDTTNHQSKDAALPAGTGDAEHDRPARIARYACLPDYHDVLKPKLYALDAFIRARTGRSELGKVFVDSAPVLERDFAAQAGLGFIGRNCCLITPGLGSWTVLAGLMVAEDLTPGPAPARRGEQEVRCGRCTRCLDACPTQAFAGPHVLDARRCISYLTIELRGPIPRELRPLMGQWVFGCDVCQEVCPYSRQAETGRGRWLGRSLAAGQLADGSGNLEPVIPAGSAAQRPMRRIASEKSATLFDLLTLDEAAFRARFRGTPVLRAKRRGLVRNACVAAGNSGDPALIPPLIALLADPEPLVRGHAAWALRRLGGAEADLALAHARTVETHPWVRSELAP